ncbi:Na(+)/H(+) antiporter subunit C [Actinomadura sp. KC345]|uniref:Na(+)/H(+) antiporter subunit C n=1 Tax=Actinomadura sp. KC345 TaxID=2530371 RepID=UPI00104D62F1|nr:Na(+)/H(+) antiporter subunit C [Actinomadura sp. KC345]TDC46764.1 Na(+)/H(+) antiporter subunit C [Actinomadura sp. KC345]
MTGPALVLVVAVAVLFAAGIDMLMERSLVRIVVGFMLLGHGANLLLLLAGGAAGSPPLLGKESERPMADPLPQAMALTAIVITFGVTAFLLALAYRSRITLGEDEVRDDVEDRRIHAERRREAWAAGAGEEADPLEEDAQEHEPEHAGASGEDAPHRNGGEGA